MGLSFANEAQPEMIETSVRNQYTLPEFLKELLTRERQAREERRVKTGLKLSGLAVAKTQEEFDFDFQRSLNKNQIELLPTCEFARWKENILFIRPHGVGKSPLAT